MNIMKKVLFMIRTLWNGGGTETYVFTLARSMQRLGHCVGVYTSGGAWVNHFRKHGLRVHVAPSYTRSEKRLQAIVQKYGYDNIHANDGPSISLISRVKSRTFRTTMTIHGQYVPPEIVRKSGEIASSVIVVTPSVFQFVHRCGVPMHKIRMLPNAISIHSYRSQGISTLRRKFGIPDSSFVIGYAGRFTFDKVALSKRISGIVRRYVAESANTHAMIAGRGAKRYLKNGRRFIVLGQINNMTDFFHSCNVVIGTARVALEGMASGKSVIAVGYNHYIGPVSSTNFDEASISNFGDHGHQIRKWKDARLISDLNQLRRSNRTAETRTILRMVRSRFSVDVLSKNLLSLYK